MGIVTPALPAIVANHSKSKTQHSFSILDKSNSMSQDYHQGIFSFSNGFERSPITQQEHHHHQQQHIPQQIRRDKGRVQGFEAAPPPLVGIEEEESGGLPVYETTGMLSEMFNFPPAGATAVELLDPPTAANYRSPRPQPAAIGVGQEWYGGRHGLISGFGPQEEANGHRNISQQHHHQIPSINGDSAAAMQLFLMNPQARSPSPPPHHNHGTNAPLTSTLHMLLPNPQSSSLQGFTGTASGAGGSAFGQFTWVPDSAHDGNTTTSEIGRVVEGQGLSLSLSSSLQHLEAAKAEEFRMADSGFLYYSQGPGGSGSSSAAQYPYKNLGSNNPQALNIQGHVTSNHQVHVGFGASSLGVVNALRNSKYLKATQELLEEFCSVGRGPFKKNKLGRQHSNPNSNPGPSTSSKDAPPSSAADRIEHQRRKVKLLAMLDEVDRRYNHYCEQMQMVVNSFDMVMGFGAAVPYTALAQKAMSRHFRCLKDAITAQLKHSCELLGEKDGAGASAGLTKGETPRLKLLEQSLRQQRSFHQMGMMEQETWRPQRGLPERSVNILRAWLFEHFLHPYPSDADKHVLARQTGLSRNQVSNWFINARVRLWKPMVEDMYQQEAKDEEGTDEDTQKNHRYDNSGGFAQTPTSSTRTATTQPLPSTTAMIQQTAAATSTTTTPTGKRSDINATESDPSSLNAINRQCFSENQAKQSNSSLRTMTPIMVHTTTATPSEVVPPVPQCSATPHDSDDLVAGDACKVGTRMVSNDCGAATGGADLGSTLIRYGTTPGDVSLTLGLRHAGNPPEKSSAFSMRDFGGI